MKTSYRIVISVFTLLLALSSTGYSQTDKQSMVLVSMDFSEALAKTLTAETSIEVVRAIPVNYSPDVQPSYIKKNWAKFSAIASKADAALTLTGAWPKDPLYPWARKANIRIVPIDMVSPLNRGRAGIPLLEMPDGGDQFQFIWNSPGNAARMADITASDLTQLFPGEKEKIEGNLDIFKQELFKLRTSYEIAFSELDYFELISFTTNFLYLTDEFGIGVVKLITKPEHKWKEQDLRELEEAITSSDINCVLAKWQPNKEITDNIQKSGAKVLILKPFRLNKALPASRQLLQFYQDNLLLLVNGLSTKK